MFLTWKSDESFFTEPSFTTRAPSALSISDWKVAILRRYGSPPDCEGVESALAMFSEMTCMRPAWARRPEAAIAIDFIRSMVFLKPPLRVAASPADRRLDQAQPARV